MPSLALKPQVKTIPPDLAAVLGNAPIHPALLLAPLRPVPPSAATLTSAALAMARHASYAATSALEGFAAGTRSADGNASEYVSGNGHEDPHAYGWLPAGASGFFHMVGSGGVLHLEPLSRPRALSLAHGSLSQRGTSRPRLQPGAVRLLPPGHALTLADLEGNGALAVEVVF
jgi:hypothetical protein